MTREAGPGVSPSSHGRRDARARHDPAGSLAVAVPDGSASGRAAAVPGPRQPRTATGTGRRQRSIGTTRARRSGAGCSASMGDGCYVTKFEWSGANTEWGRLCDAGAERDFTGAPAGPPDPHTLRAHIARRRKPFQTPNTCWSPTATAATSASPPCATGTRALPSMRLACLSTPFVNVRPRADSAVLMGFLQGAGFVALGVALFGSIYWVSRLIPEPWDTPVWVVGFIAQHARLGDRLGSSPRQRRTALRQWGVDETDRASRAPRPRAARRRRRSLARAQARRGRECRHPRTVATGVLRPASGVPGPAPLWPTTGAWPLPVYGLVAVGSPGLAPPERCGA